MPTFDFDPSAVTPVAAPSFEPIPKGHYEAIILDTDVKETKRGDGQYIAVTFQITEGEYTGRRVWQNLNVSNPNKQAEDIGRAELSSLCHAVNVDKMTDTEMLHDIPLSIEVGIDRRDETRNRVLGYSQLHGAPQRVVAAAKPASPAKPWEKK